MNEAIEQVLNDETLTTTEERVEAIKKGLATLVIPKDKYNDLNTKLKSTESNLTNLTSEFEEFKKSKMTNDEKAKAEREAFEKQVEENKRTKSELAVKSLLLDNGIKVTESDEDAELRETLDTIISSDYDKSIKLAKSFINLLNKTKETTKKETTTELLNDTPKPIGGVDSSKSVSKLEQLNEQLKQAVKDNDTYEQVRLYGLIAEEKNKVKI